MGNSSSSFTSSITKKDGFCAFVGFDEGEEGGGGGGEDGGGGGGGGKEGGGRGGCFRSVVTVDDCDFFVSLSSLRSFVFRRVPWQGFGIVERVL